MPLLLTFIKISAVTALFYFLVRFLFSGSGKEFKRPTSLIEKDIERLKTDVGRLKGKLPNKEFGELMDDLSILKISYGLDKFKPILGI